MLKILNNIEEKFLGMDEALKIFNKDIAAMPTQQNIISKLPSLNILLSQKLSEIKIDLSDFDIALQTQKIAKDTDSDIANIEKSKIVVEDTITGLIKNINQLKISQKNSPLGVGITELLKNTEEWKFLLEKHLEQYNTILNLLR